MKKLGLIVNPVAGMGGKVGLKGTDGKDILKKALKLGAEPTSPARAVEALKMIKSIEEDVELITYSKEMGEEEAEEAGFKPTIIGEISSGKTTAEDTKKAAKMMYALGVDLILFAGGDGTARDIYDAVEGKVPVLGIPAGVKIQSGVFAINPKVAGDMAARYLKGEIGLRELEVMDIDEDAYRNNRLSARLHGFLKVPYEEVLIQGYKEATRGSIETTLEAIASEIIEGMEESVIYIIGPGTTTRIIVETLGFKKTLLGVDVILDKKMIAKDVNEESLLSLLNGKDAKIVVTVIGGQGFVFGRGNQQISSKVINKVGVENVIIIATPEKLAGLKSKTLFVDTGDNDLDNKLSGYHKVVTGYARRVVCKVLAQ